MWRCTTYIMLTLFFCSKSFSEWSENAWTNEYFVDKSDCVTTSLYGYAVSKKLEISSTTNLVPTLTEIEYPSIAEMLVQFEAAMPITGSSTSNYIVYTNDYYSNLSYANYAITNSAETNIYSATNTFVSGGLTNWCYATGTVIKIGGKYDFVFDADNVRDYESLAAINERQLAIYGSNAALYHGNFFYNESPYNIQIVKGWILTNLSKFADISVSSNTMNSNYDFLQYIKGSNSYYTYNPTNSMWYTNYESRTIPAYTQTSLLCQAGAPIDWFGGVYYNVATGEASKTTKFYEKVAILSNDAGAFWYVVTNATYRRDLQLTIKDFYGSGERFGSIITTTVEIARYPLTRWIVWTNIGTNYQQWTNFCYSYDENEIITNDVYLYDGNMTNMVGTNGQIVSTSRFYGVEWTNTIGTNQYIYDDDPIRITDSSDYGYKYLTSILSRLVVLIGGAEWETTNAAQKYGNCDLTQFITNAGTYADGYYNAFFSPIEDGFITNDYSTTNVSASTPSKLLYEEDTFGSFYSYETTPRIVISNYIFEIVQDRVLQPTIETYTFSYFGSDRFISVNPPVFYENDVYEYLVSGVGALSSLPDMECDDLLVSNHIDAIIYTTSVTQITVDDDNIGFHAYTYNPTNKYFDFDSDYSYTHETDENIFYTLWYDQRYFDEYFDHFYVVNIGAAFTSISNGGLPEAFCKGTASSGFVSDVYFYNYSGTNLYDPVECDSVGGCDWISGNAFGLIGRCGSPPGLSGISFYWNMYSVRNYAVTNGFKYY